jgi:hypothetical protein
MTEPRLLYACNEFALFDNQVDQGEFTAMADANGLYSNYFTETTDLGFKFSLGGRDNELGYGIDHQVVMEPVDGRVDLPVIPFGHLEPIRNGQQNSGFSALPPHTRVRFRLDLNGVLAAIWRDGGYRTPTGDWVTASDLERVEVCGNKPPLNWNFGKNGPNAPVRLTDDDGDGIYEAEVVFHVVEMQEGMRVLHLPESGPHFRFNCESPLPEAIHRLALHELTLNEREDGAWNTGAHWDGVWTRDAAYAIWLSLGLADPERSKACLRARVHAGRVLQDTGTGGSWPVSTDRIVWSVAAWEVYLACGERSWLEEIYPLTVSMLEEADAVALNEEGLYRGETSFLDWRQQSYPKWMTPSDIFESTGLSTNVLYYLGWTLRAEMEAVLGYDPQFAKARAGSLEARIRKAFWHGNTSLLGQFRYGRPWQTLSQRPDSLALALAALGGIVKGSEAESVLRTTPATPYGIPCFSPFIPDEPAYHNRGIWPFVQAYWNWALARHGSEAMLVEALAAFWRPAALFMTHKENFRADNGMDRPTEVNSDRQLWSVAGALSIPVRVLAGIHLLPEGIQLQPAVPLFLEGGFSFTIDIRSTRWRFRFFGNGRTIREVTLNGQVHTGLLPYDSGNEALVQVFLDNEAFGDQMTPALVREFSLPTPVIREEGGYLRWQAPAGVRSTRVYRNGLPWIETQGEVVEVKDCPKGSVFQAMFMGEGNVSSFLCEPVWLGGFSPEITWTPAEGPFFLGPAQPVFSCEVEVPKDGTYWLFVDYANGQGDIPNGDRCGLRLLYVNEKRMGAVAFPHRQAGNWNVHGPSSLIKVELQSGKNRLELKTDPVAAPAHPNENLIRVFGLACWRSSD